MKGATKLADDGITEPIKPSSWDTKKLIKVPIMAITAANAVNKRPLRVRNQTIAEKTMLPRKVKKPIKKKGIR
jgi:hypothetical protein